MAFLIMLLVVAGCSGSSPVTPGKIPDSISSLPIIAPTQSGDLLNATGLLGAYELSVDPQKATGELVAMRTSTVGESYIVEGGSYFTISPCSNCLKIKSIEMTNEGYIKLFFEIRHPFKAGDIYKPPSGLNRLDLDIFDVSAVIVPVEPAPAQFQLTGTAACSSYAISPDGYTIDLSEFIGNPAAMPYYLALDDSIATPPAKTWNKLAMGASSKFDITLDLSSGNLKFNIYMTFGYGASAKRPQRLEPKYYNPEFNRKAAWKIDVIPPQGSLPPAAGNTWNDMDNTTQFTVTVKVYDWQVGAVVTSDPSNYASETDTGKVYAGSEVASVSVEIPGMTNSLPVVTDDDGTGSGMPDSPLVFSIPIRNENHLSEGVYTGLVKVKDTRPVMAPVQGRDFLIQSPNGVLLQNNSIPEFATYQTFPATVLRGNLPPTCDVHTNTDTTGKGGIVLVDPGTSQGSSPIISYEYDFNYDGTTFTPDKIQNSVDPDFGNPVSLNAPCIEGVFRVAMRVCSDATPPLCSICSKYINITNRMGEVGDVSVTNVNRGESGVNERLITSVDFDWTPNPCAAEYAIESSDGYEPSTWTVIGTSTTSDFNFIPQGLDLDNDIRFRVIVREIAGGDPLTDSGSSEEVFILFMSSMGDMGGTYENNWPVVNKMVGGGIMITRWYWDIDDWPECGLGFLGDPCVPNTSMWSIAYTPKQIPDFSGQKRAWSDGYITPGANWDSQTIGFCIGTISTPPVADDICADFEPANDIYDPSYYAYNAPNVEGLNTQFDETNQDGWRLENTLSDPVYHHVGYYLNDLLDPDRGYIAIGFANGSEPIYDPGTG